MGRMFKWIGKKSFVKHFLYKMNTRDEVNLGKFTDLFTLVILKKKTLMDTLYFVA